MSAMLRAGSVRDDAIARTGPRIAMIVLGVVGALALGAGVARTPVAGLAVVGIAAMAWYAWPRWLRIDVEYFAAGLLVLAVLQGVASRLQVGAISVGGILTVAEVVTAVLLLIHASGPLGAAWRSIWPLVAFVGWLWASAIIGGASVAGIQNLVVLTAFVVIATLAYVRAVEDPAVAETLGRLFERTFWLLAILGVVSLVVHGPGGGFLVAEHGSSRSFALLLLPMIASGLSRWRVGDRWHGAAIAILGVALTALSLSRAALVVGCVLFALARFTPRSIAGVVRLLGGLVAAIALLWATIAIVTPLHDRFFATRGDLVDIGGYTVNATGRTDLWTVTWREFQRSPWLGHGPGSSEEFLSKRDGGAHPHNDYLRLLHDYGIVGTALWGLGIVVVVTALYRAWLRQDADGDAAAGIQLWALLSVGALLGTMITANPIVYMHVQGPLALIVGTALGAGARNRMPATPWR